MKLNKPSTNTITILLLSSGLMLSANLFAAKPSSNNYATETDLNEEILARTNADNALQNNINAITTDIGTNATAIADLQDALPVHEIGEQYAGGKIFYLDASGQHGLIAALADQTPPDSGIKWYNGDFKDTGATGDGIGAGEMNTAIIISTQIGDTGNRIFAAKLAADYSIGDDGETTCTGDVDETCYGDWYLPSKFELNLLYNQKSVVGGFANAYYWSSSEDDSNVAWSLAFDLGDQDDTNESSTLRVRAVRAF